MRYDISFEVIFNTVTNIYRLAGLAYYSDHVLVWLIRQNNRRP